MGPLDPFFDYNSTTHNRPWTPAEIAYAHRLESVYLYEALTLASFLATPICVRLFLWRVDQAAVTARHPAFWATPVLLIILATSVLFEQNLRTNVQYMLTSDNVPTLQPSTHVSCGASCAIILTEVFLCAMVVLILNPLWVSLLSGKPWRPLYYLRQEKNADAEAGERSNVCETDPLLPKEIATEKAQYCAI